MKVSMDHARRIVIPKSVRDGLGLRPDESFELAVESGAIRLELLPSPSRLEIAEDGLPVLRAVNDRVLTSLDVRSIRDHDQR